MNSKNLLSFVAAAVLLMIINQISALDYFTKKCCKAHDSVSLGFICDDGKYAPFSGCCGVGSCNMACCNCDGGCRTGSFSNAPSPIGWPSAELTPNLGLVGTGPNPIAASDFAKEAIKTGTIQTGKGIGSAANDLRKKTP